MAILGGFPFQSGISQAQTFGSFSSSVQFAGGSPVGFSQAGSLVSLVQTLQQMLGAFQQLSSGWGGLLGAPSFGAPNPSDFSSLLGGGTASAGFAFSPDGGNDFSSILNGGIASSAFDASSLLGGFSAYGGFDPASILGGGGNDWNSLLYGSSGGSTGFDPSSLFGTSNFGTSAFGTGNGAIYAGVDYSSVLGAGTAPLGYFGAVAGSSTGYGGSSTPTGPALPFPSDGGDFASYLQAQVAGGALQGQTSVRQSDGIAGTRFAGVESPQLWHANVGRLYAYQFAAYASNNDPLSAQGLQAGAQAMQTMSPDAQLFVQVASVFKGNLMQGPGFYNNPGLKDLLLQRGLGELANQPGVGETDVQTVGAITKALNSGALSLQDIIQSGTIDNLNRYQQVIQYVQGGQFASDLQGYDRVAF